MHHKKDLEQTHRATARVNEFAFKLANVNGTGSASANSLLMKSVFRMGVPVSGKNFFPSNIQGLPTWYEIRVSKHAHTARTADYDLIVAMNAETYARDVQEVLPGGYVLYDSTWPRRGRKRSAASTATCRPCSPMRNASNATPASTSVRPPA